MALVDLTSVTTGSIGTNTNFIVEENKVLKRISQSSLLKTSAISTTQVNSTTNVPSSSLVYSMNQSINKLNSDLDNNIFPFKPTVTINIGENGSFLTVKVLNGICYLYIDMYAADIPALDQYDALDLCTIPEGYRPNELIWVNPQNIDGENAWKGCKFGITASGAIQLSTRWAAISPTENSSRSYTRVFFPIAW